VFGKRSDDTRTAEDRARAAAERAARRAGRPLPPEAFADAVPPPDMDGYTRPEPPPADVPQRTAPEPQADAPDPTPPPADDPPPPAAEPPAWSDPPPETPHQPTAEYTPFATEEHAAPLTAVTERPVEPPRRPAPAVPRRRPPAPPAGPRRGRGRFWGRRVFGLAALLVILAALYVINATFQPFHGKGHGAVAVVVPAGADAGRIGDLLAAAGVIDNGTFFQLNATITGRRGDLHPGHYTLAKGMSYGDALDALTKGPKAARVVPSFKVTIPEGPSRREVAALLGDSAVQGDYMKASATPSVLRKIRRLGAPKGTKTAEGFLFPATYTLSSGGTAQQLVAQQLTAFADNFRHVSMSYAKRKHLSRYDVLIIASMIEREAQVQRDRPLIAAVIYNRLKQGMPLAIDATIRYYIGNWKRPIRESELQADEPYNTRLNRGLPPTPIGNPGLASLQAAAHPAHKSYLYFVRKPGSSGEHAFSSTAAQFERDNQRYQQSRGGG
jgi:UPF0755 protein